MVTVLNTFLNGSDWFSIGFCFSRNNNGASQGKAQYLAQVYNTLEDIKLRLRLCSVVREMLFRSINLPLTHNLGISDFIFLFEGYLGPVEPRPLARTQQHGPRGHVCIRICIVSIPLKIWRTTLTDSVYGLKMKLSWDIF